ncbi:MAG: hypothetical protein MIO93_10525, partial [ANME-2 cluster archaeon]|nr:hypothetical protein [ANME-2 cluster archaeon]
MRTRSIIITIVAALLLFSVASNAVYAEEQGSLIDELTEIDAFHPPVIGESRNMMYNEWHYFNVMDEEQGLSLMTTLKLSGDIYDPIPFNSSVATVVLSYSTPDGENITGDNYPITPDQVEFSSETPDIRIYSSTVTLTDEGYHVHVESADRLTVFDAMFKPFTEPAPFFIAPYKEEGQDRMINWLVASPKMKVNGTLTISKGTDLEHTYTLENVRGYHDHNWGYWLWQDDIGWDWGQASENQLDVNDEDKYAFCFGNVTNNEHTKSRGAVLNIWKNKTIIAGFENETIQIQHFGMVPVPELNNSFPMGTVLTADDGDNSMSISFSTEDVTPIPVQIGDNKYLVIWELTGTYEVSGCIDGKPVSYTSKGFMEYVTSSICSDITDPVIVSATLDDTTPCEGDTITVTVVATDDSGVVAS